MPRAKAVSLHLAHFDALQKNLGLARGAPDGTLFCTIGADSRAAGTEPAAQQAFTFAMLGLHADEDSARATVSARRTLAPWLDGAREVWGAVMLPFRHKGEVNWLDQASPGLVLESAASPASSTPFVSITSAGWNQTPDLDRSRMQDFGTGVSAVRMAMTGVDGLGSQQSFFPPGGIHDPFTVSFWRDDDAIRAFAFGRGEHRHQLDRYRERHNADRTSFSRFVVSESHGTWRGRAPLAFGAPS